MSSTLSLKKYIAVSAILLVLIMTVLDGTLVNVALPVMAESFGVSDSSIVWIVTIYQLMITMLLLPVSSYGDIFSYKKSFMTGVAVFTLSSVLCAASQSFPMILAARALQGIGAACIMGVNIALTRLIYPREILGRGMALNTMVIAVATASGPTLVSCRHFGIQAAARESAPGKEKSIRQNERHRECHRVRSDILRTRKFRT